MRIWIGLGAFAGVTAVAMAAAGAHAGLPAVAREALQSGVQMQGWHALALLFTGLWAERGGWPAQAAGAAFVLGMLAFCGAVYGLALTGVLVPALAPTGGVLLMLGWVLLGISALRRS